MSKTNQGRRGRPLGMKLSQASKDQISKSKTGYQTPEETKRKISNTLIKYFNITGRHPDTIVKCKGCGELFETKNRYIPTIYCKNCLDCFLHNGNIGEYKKVYKKLKDLKQFKLWRLKILVRDKFRCRICGKVGQCVHHIIDIMKIQDIPELLYNTDIGLTLCTSCHGKVHTYIRQKRVQEIKK